MIFGIKICGYVEPDKLSELARICATEGAELSYSPCGERFFEIWRDSTDGCDFGAFYQSVRRILVETH